MILVTSTFFGRWNQEAIVQTELRDKAPRLKGIYYKGVTKGIISYLFLIYCHVF